MLVQYLSIPISPAPLTIANCVCTEGLAATPEDRPLIAEIRQSPPVSFSSTSGSQAGAAAAAALAAVPDASLLDAPLPAALMAPAGGELQGNGMAAAQLAELPVPPAADGLAREGSLHSHAIETAPSIDVDGIAAAASAAPTGPGATVPTDGAAATAAEAPAASAGDAGAPLPAAQPAPAAAAVEARPQRPPPPPLDRGELLDAFK